MHKLSLVVFLASMSLGACSSSNPLFAPSVSDLQDRSQLSGADQAVHIGKYDSAEKILGQYVHRDEHGNLKMKYLGISGDNRKQAVDTVVTLLWETGRDDTLKQFAKDYLSGDEYKATMCRISERQALYEEAYHCWNKMGEGDRAERVIRTEAALRILGTP
jgi:hypothetical protein